MIFMKVWVHHYVAVRLSLSKHAPKAFAYISSIESRE